MWQAIISVIFVQIQWEIFQQLLPRHNGVESVVYNVVNIVKACETANKTNLNGNVDSFFLACSRISSCFSGSLSKVYSGIGMSNIRCAVDGSD